MLLRLTGETCYTFTKRMVSCSFLGWTLAAGTKLHLHSRRLTNTIRSGRPTVNGVPILPTREATFKFGGLPQLEVKNNASQPVTTAFGTFLFRRMDVGFIFSPTT